MTLPGFIAGRRLPDSHRRARQSRLRTMPASRTHLRPPPTTPVRGGATSARAHRRSGTPGRRPSPHHLEENRSEMGAPDPPPSAATAGPTLPPQPWRHNRRRNPIGPPPHRAHSASTPGDQVRHHVSARGSPREERRKARRPPSAGRASLAGLLRRRRGSRGKGGPGGDGG